MITIKDFPLRERKKARTRLAIIDALIDRVNNKHFEEITIDEICDDVQISRGTFFIYFPRKIDMLWYIGLLWNMEISWYTTMAPGVSPGLHAIEDIFIRFARLIEQSPNIFSEFISLRSREPQGFIKLNQPGSRQVSTAERVLRFPELKGIESITEGTSSRLFHINLDAAIAKEEIPKNINITTCELSLGIILYGIPFMLINKNPGNLAEAFSYHLNLLWTGLKTSYH
jgi:AcrR family transcriptional regulator